MCVVCRENGETHKRGEGGRRLNDFYSIFFIMICRHNTEEVTTTMGATGFVVANSEHSLDTLMPFSTHKKRNIKNPFLLLSQAFDSTFFTIVTFFFMCHIHKNYVHSPSTLGETSRKKKKKKLGNSKFQL